MRPSWFRPEFATITLVVSVLVAIASIALAPRLIARLPADYFVRDREADRARPGKFARAARNALGIVLVLAGIAMLVLPGQGVLTILVGLALTSFPGKRRLQLNLLRRPAIHRTIARIREKAGKPPLELEA